MSERRTFDLGIWHGLERALVVRDHGSAGVTISTETPASESHSGTVHAYQQHVVHQSIRIPVEYVPAVALALLGGITDDLVEQCAQAIHHRWNPRNPQQPWLWWENGAEQHRENRRADARAVLAAIGGGGEHANRRG